MKRLLALIAIGAQFISSALAGVGDTADFSSLSNCKFVQGKVSPNDLKGKVVFIEYWGTHCPPCRAAMPKLQAMYAKHAKNGFVLIGSHVQMDSDANITKFLQDGGYTFPVCHHFNLPQAPVQGGIPHSVLIGANGKVLAAGHPNSVEPMVEEAMKKVNPNAPITEGLNLQKYKKYEKTLVAGAPDIEGKIAPLRESGDEEAQQICEAVDQWAGNKKNQVEGLKSTDALEFVAQAAELRRSMPSITDFDEDVEEMKGDPAFEKLSNLRKALKAAEKKADGGKPVPPSTVSKLLKGVEGIESDNAAIQGSCESLKEKIQLLPKSSDGKKGGKAEKKSKRK